MVTSVVSVHRSRGYRGQFVRCLDEVKHFFLLLHFFFFFLSVIIICNSVYIFFTFNCYV